MNSDPLAVITDQTELNAFCERLSSADVLFLDTEFHRETTYWPTLCLIQVADWDTEGMIDPLSSDLDLTPFLDLLRSPTSLKVFHAARQDLEIFTRMLGEAPKNIFDTQIAAMALGLGDSISFDNLIGQTTGKQIDKSSQFTDWTRRPLSKKQLTYALGDVTYLRDAFSVMSQKLEAKDRWSWVNTEMASLSDPELYRTEPEDAWKRLKLRRPKKDYLAVMYLVAAWRERLAQELNRPRSRILKDDAIQEIADQRPRTADAMERLRSVPRGFSNSRHGPGLLEAINKALDDVDTYAPDVEKAQQRGPAPAGASDLLRVLLKQVCDDAQVTPRLVANSADLDKVASGEGHETQVMYGWRYELFGKLAEDLLSGRLAITFKGKDIRLFDVPDS